MSLPVYSKLFYILDGSGVMLLRLLQAGGIFTFIGYFMVATIFAVSSLVLYVILSFPIIIIVDIFSSNSDESVVEIVLTVCILFSMGVVAWILHRHLETSRPILTTKARFLKFSEGKMRGGGLATFELPNNKKLALTVHGYPFISLKRDDMVTLTYQGMYGISAKKIPPSPPPPEPQFSKPQTLQRTQRKPLPPVRKTTTPQSRNTPSYNKATRK